MCSSDLAAHNEYAQGLAEFGIIGVGLFAWFLLEHRLGAVFVVAVVSLIGFPLQNPATALLFVAGLGLSEYCLPSRRSWRMGSLLLPTYRFLQQKLS